MSEIDFQDGGCGGHLEFSIGSFSYFVSTRHPKSTRHPNAHHQVSIQLDYRGDVQNMNSQHFSQMYMAHTNAWGSKFDLAVKRSNINTGPSF